MGLSEVLWYNFIMQGRTFKLSILILRSAPGVRALGSPAVGYCAYHTSRFFLPAFKSVYFSALSCEPQVPMVRQVSHLMM